MREGGGNIMANTRNVVDFYNGMHVLITGGSGFMGKILLESLLRKTEVSRIYLIIRSKNGKSTNDREKEILSDSLFSTLLKENGQVFNKVKVLNGDLTADGMGLSVEDRDHLIEYVNIIFHGAATVQFNENLKTAIEINIGGTKKMLDLAKSMKNLKAFLHISTAYTNAHLKEIHEKIYPSERKVNLLEFADCIDYDTADKITSFVKGDALNTYILTKRVAEEMVNSITTFPVGILRPGIVLGCSKEPIPGWMDNLYGPTGTIIGIITGLIHVVICDPDSLADLVPVDMAVNCLIASAWDVHHRYKNEKGILIYNYVSSSVAPITWGQFTNEVKKRAHVNPPQERLWHTFTIGTRTSFAYSTLCFFFHYIPAFILDTMKQLTGNKPRFVKMYRRIDNITEICIPFSMNSWRFSVENVTSLWERLDNTDKQFFPFDLNGFNWQRYLTDYVVGIKTFLLKEKPEKEHLAKTNKNRCLWLHYGVIITLSVVICSSFACFLRTSLIGYFYKFVQSLLKWQ